MKTLDCEKGCFERKSKFTSSVKIFISILLILLIFPTFAVFAETSFDEDSISLATYGDTLLPPTSMTLRYIASTELPLDLRFDTWLSTYSLYFNPKDFVEIGSIAYIPIGSGDLFRFYAGLGTAFELTQLATVSVPIILSLSPEFRFGKYVLLDGKINAFKWQIDLMNYGFEAKTRLRFVFGDSNIFASATVGYLVYTDGATNLNVPQYTIEAGYRW